MWNLGFGRSRNGAISLLLLTALAAPAKAQQFEEIIVTARTRPQDPTLIEPDAESLLSTPGAVNDPLQALLALPGISFGGGDLNPPVIRGGGPDDNLYLVDDIPVGQVFHELNDSIISPNTLRTFDLHSAAFGPAYGDAVGGVIDIGLRDPLRDGAAFKLDLSQLKSGVMAEFPVVGPSSAYISYRHNLAHLFLKNFERGNDILVFKMPQSRDYSGRYIWRGDSFDITFTALGAWDKTEEEQNENIPGPTLFGNVERRRFDSQALRYRKYWADGSRLNVTLAHSDSSRDKTERNGDFTRLDIESWTLRGHYDRSLGRHDLTLGLNAERKAAGLRFQGLIPLCDYFGTICGGAYAATGAGDKETFQRAALYVDDTLNLTDRLRLETGLRLAHDDFLDQSFAEPRLGVSFRPAPPLELYARVGLHHQTPDIERLLLIPQFAHAQQTQKSIQALVGQRWDISEGWRLQTEAYYKDFDIQDLTGTPLAQDINGKAYGVDILLAKPISRHLFGWFAVSYQKSVRSAGIQNFDDEYSAPLSATLAVNYAFDDGWRAGIKWRGQSGAAYTPLKGVTFDPKTGRAALNYGAPYSERLKFYSRLDIRLEKQAEYRFGDVTYYVDVLNILDRENLSDRDYPLRNLHPDGHGGYDIAPDDDAGVPFFVALGVNFSF